jgi:hypothetical protein|tara:strand:+ start:144 stop:578 length:435 start_codon:yes stop_codon:yes gene_type:complete
MNENNIAYLAGLFDGEGSIHYRQGWEKKKKHKGEGYRKTKTWRISMEIAMTDEAVIRWVHETLKVGSVLKRNIKGRTKSGGKYKPQWRWRCTFRDAYYVARLIWPHVQVKLHKVEQIIDHYSPDHVFDEKVVSLQQYREAMILE